jgi:RNA polymerase sigma-70 factor (ECF subfamily)
MSELDPTLLDRCQQGDNEAFAQLMAEQQDYVYTLAKRILRDSEEAADLTQEVFLQVWRGLPGFRQAARFRTWLYRIVVNRGLNYLRKLRRRRNMISLDQQNLEILSAQADPPHAEAWQKERRTLIWENVKRLPTKYQTALTLFYQHEMSCAEIAEVLSIPVGTVKTHLHRGRRALAEMLPGGDEDAL